MQKKELTDRKPIEQATIWDSFFNDPIFLQLQEIDRCLIDILDQRTIDTEKEYPETFDDDSIIECIEKICCELTHIIWDINISVWCELYFREKLLQTIENRDAYNNEVGKIWQYQLWRYWKEIFDIISWKK